MAKVKSVRGVEIDMAALARMNSDNVAVSAGGVKMNANGDEIGPGGKIIRSAEQIKADTLVAQDAHAVNVADVTASLVAEQKSGEEFLKQQKTIKKAKMQKEASSEKNTTNQVSAAKTTKAEKSPVKKTRKTRTIVDEDI